MALKFLALLICSLAICEVLSATTGQSPTSQRRPNEYLQPPPPPPPPSPRRQPPNARPRNFRVTPASSGATSRSPSTSTSNHIPLSGPNAGGSKQISSGSTTRLNKVAPAGPQRLAGGNFVNSGRIQHQKPIESPQRANSNNSGNSSNIVVGRVHRPSSGSPQEKQRVARWFLSRPIVDSEAQPSRTHKAILRPPPGPANYNQVSLQPPPPPHPKQSSSATHIHAQFHPPPPPQSSRSQHHKLKDCNPCNKVPWIPIPRGIAHDGIESGHSQGVSNSYLSPAPPLSSQYELPSVGSLPLQSPSAAEHYGPPVSSFSATFTSTQDQYSPPPPPIKLLDDQFRPPPPAQTISSQYGAPLSELGSHHVSLNNEYGPPPPPPSSFGHSIKDESSPQLAPSYLPAAPVYEPVQFDEIPSSGRGHNGGSTSYIKQNFGPEHPSISVEQTHPQIQESHPLESLLDQQQSHSHAQSVEHPVSYASQHSGNSDISHSNVNDGGDSSVDIVKSIPIIEDSYSVASHHPAPTAIYTAPASEQIGSETSHLNKEQTLSTSSNSIGFEQQRYEYNQQQGQQQQQYNPQQQQGQQQQQYNPQQQQQYQQEQQYKQQQHQNNQQIQQQRYHPHNQHQEYQQHQYNQQQNIINPYSQSQDHIRNGNQQSSLEIIPSIPVIDYLSSIEYPLQIIQSPFIDVTEPPDQPAVRGTKEGTITGFDTHAGSTSYSSSSGSWSSANVFSGNSSKITDSGDGEIIIGKPTLKASTLNVSFSEARDQKISATNLKNHNLEARPVVVDYPTNVDLHESSSLEEHKETSSQVNLDITDTNNIKQEFTSSAKDTFIIQPSIQTSAEEGNSLIHQINNVFESHKTSAETLPPFQQSSNYVVFQNFPQPPIGYLPQDVLQQKLPPPTPFQSTIKYTPHVITTPHTPTSTFGHSLKLEAPISFLNPPPRNSHEAYTTVSNTPAPPSNTFWTPPPGKFLSTPISPSAETTSLAWGNPTTSAPFKISNPSVINAFAEAAGLLPPPPALPSQVPNKKPKQIQIIVPYTSSKDLMQFHSFPENKNPATESTGWQPMLATSVENSPVVQQGRKAPSKDYHANQESRTVTSKTPVSDATYNELQHIFAKNIRDLLRGEQDVNGNVRTTPDTLRLQDLQKNIDEWTALEYSKRRNTGRQNKIKNNTIVETQKATTSSATAFHHLLVPSKQIPEEYFTTTPSLFDDIKTTENSVATAFPRLRKYENYSSTSSPTSTARISNFFYDNEASGSQRHSIRTAVVSNDSKSDRTGVDSGATTFLIDTPPNHQRKVENHKWKIIESNYILPEAVASQSVSPHLPSTSTTSSTTTTATTTLPPTTTLQWEDATEALSTTERTTTWEKLTLSISPFTNEKVYVVTPVTTERTTVSPTPSTTTTTAAQWRGNIRHSTSINDIFPFRNGPPKAERLVATTPVDKDNTSSPKADSTTFRSPRFNIRPTPGAPLQRSFTVSSDSAGERTSRHAGGRSLKLESAVFNEIRVSEPKKSPPGTTTTRRPFLDVFLELTDLPTYTPPNGTKVETLTGHSKVITVATQPTVSTPLYRQVPAQNTKKSTTSSGNGITKLYLVSTSTAAPSTTSTTTTGSSHPKPRGGITSRNGTRWATSRIELSNSWQFPDLSKEESESVEAADVELKKEKRLR